MRSQKIKRRVAREDVKALADAIAREIVMWCVHSSGDPVDYCLAHHMQNPDFWEMYVPEEYQTLYERVLRSRRKTAAVGRLEAADRFEVESALGLLARCGLLYGGRGFLKRVEDVRFDACGRLRVRYAGGGEHVVYRGKTRLLINLRFIRLKKEIC